MGNRVDWGREDNTGDNRLDHVHQGRLGEIIKGSKRVHASIHLQIEAYALLQGIIALTKVHLKKLLIWSDSRVLINCINNVRECPKS